MNLTELKLKQVTEIIAIAESLGLENIVRARKQELILELHPIELLQEVVGELDVGLVDLVDQEHRAHV